MKWIELRRWGNSFFYDSRVNYLEDQAIAVITNENEMHGSLEKSASDLNLKKPEAQKDKLDTIIEQNKKIIELLNKLVGWLRV